MPIALDATYSHGLTGVGVYSREILFGLARAHPGEKFLYCYRPHQFLPSFREPLPKNAARRILTGRPPGEIFHALNQRVDVPARRTVATFHDLFVITGDYSTPDFRARFTEQARGAAERSDLIIAVSRFTANQVESLLRVEASRIRVIPHGVHIPPAFTSQRENVVLSVGALQHRKNFVRLVKAFETLPPSWQLKIAGPDDGFRAAEIIAAIHQSPRREAIDVLGYVSQPELERLYQRASIFAFPSLDEGFGMPVLDAMAHGIPVITSTRSALPEVAGDAALLVDPEDTAAIADALHQLATDDHLRADLAERGLDRARQFPWTSAVESTWSVYDELV